jgi:hypothetical protein
LLQALVHENDTAWNDDNAWSDPMEHVGAYQAPHQQAHQAPHHQVWQALHQHVDPADVEAAELIDWSCIPDFDDDDLIPNQPQPQSQQVDAGDVEAVENTNQENLPTVPDPVSPSCVEKIVVPEGFDALQYLMHIVSICFYILICLKL